MIGYIAPLRELQFVLRELVPLDSVARLPGCGDVTQDVADAVLQEAAKLASGVLSPLNVIGDREGARWRDGEVTTPTGWRDAWRRFTAGGWNSLSCDPESGGQGLPRLLSAVVEEMWNASNLAFALCPLLSRGAIEALELSGSAAVKAAYLPKLVTGEWTGTMMLTEPQAGSDLSAVRARALPQGDGTYRIEGQKIFITYGEHDLTENVVHLVLARTPDAPAGVKGISLFVVPKFLPNPDGTLGDRNDVRCVSLEHKLGIHGSPTAVMALGEDRGAVGQLVGEENRGLEYMFVMMNAARFGVGLQAVGISERAYQRALRFARERIQGAELGAVGGAKMPILRHPDVRRMLLSMKSRIEAMRALTAVTAAAMDTAARHEDPSAAREAQAFVDLMIPVVKGWSTEQAVEITSLGVQVHGGMGFVEETGAAQHFRDARIMPIYEGTTGIQAADLVARKVARDRGEAIGKVIAEMRSVEAALRAGGQPLEAIGIRLGDGVAALEEATRHVVAVFGRAPREAMYGAVPYLELLGTVAGGWQMGRSALIAHGRLARGEDASFYGGKVNTAMFYAVHTLSRARGLSRTVLDGAVSGALEMADDQF
jgi:acyl-CoA dehydrogenase